MSRFTRSQIIPDWSLHEKLTLVLEIDAVDDEHGSTISSHQKWNIISNHLIALNICRNSTQCRGKWDSLLSEHRAIKDWESRSRYQTASTSRSNGGDSYWCLESDKRKDLKLPIEFDRELFGLIEGFINKEVIKTKDHKMVVSEIDSPSSSSLPPSSSSSASSLSGMQDLYSPPPPVSNSLLLTMLVTSSKKANGGRRRRIGRTKLWRCFERIAVNYRWMWNA
ncbi:hypothetical protein ZOSMA_58G00370 [Zostera marina]|uniref:Myb-like domain-containing protein n=1 Tax=Zostera marina TaxID=29655 RepID=A0A0K9NUX6_ZOSMR|nr:hypothetical protein ZOSMA_58G00370 [Zostera marina]